jgi:hypothetical protein
MPKSRVLFHLLFGISRALKFHSAHLLMISRHYGIAKSNFNAGMEINDLCTIEQFGKTLETDLYLSNITLA